MMIKSNLDWNRFKVFYHIAKAGSFTEATHILHLTQSALSRSVQKLEEQIQLKLFVRNSRGVTLTTQGRALFETVNTMYEKFVQCDIEMQEVKDEAKGSLRIALLRRLTSPNLMKHILNFQKIYPDIELHLVQHDYIENFKNLNVEMAIMPTFYNHHDLIQLPLCILRQKLYASVGYLKKFGIPQKITDFKHHRIIDFSQHHSFFNIQLKTLSKDSKSFVQPSLYINSYENIYQAVQQDLGIAFLNVEKKSETNLIEIMPDMMMLDIPLNCVYPGYLDKIKRVQLLTNYLKNVLQPPKDLCDNNDSFAFSKPQSHHQESQLAA